MPCELWGRFALSKRQDRKGSGNGKNHKTSENCREAPIIQTVEKSRYHFVFKPAAFGFELYNTSDHGTIAAFQSKTAPLPSLAQR
jgi:hypothetical protein